MNFLDLDDANANLTSKLSIASEEGNDDKPSNVETSQNKSRQQESGDTETGKSAPPKKGNVFELVSSDLNLSRNSASSITCDMETNVRKEQTTQKKQEGTEPEPKKQAPYWMFQTANYNVSSTKKRHFYSLRKLFIHHEKLLFIT